eukprot:SAG31_NODE_19121_length_611_cov_1.826172_1_plen_95_part_00
MSGSRARPAAGQRPQQRDSAPSSTDTARGTAPLPPGTAPPPTGTAPPPREYGARETDCDDRLGNAWRVGTPREETDCDGRGERAPDLWRNSNEQ